jgi:hypothetical protein
MSVGTTIEPRCYFHYRLLRNVTKHFHPQHIQIPWCQTNFFSIEDVKNCQNRGGFKQKFESIEEMLWFSAPLKRENLSLFLGAADSLNLANQVRKKYIFKNIFTKKTPNFEHK